MKNFFYSVLPFVAAAGLSVISCDPSSVVEDTDFVEEFDDLEVRHGMMELGTKMEDPYTVENMTKAVAAVYPTKARLEIQPSDIYVRFRPLNDLQYDALVNLGLELTDYPLDYKIVREGDYYHDPSVPEGSITWQYAVVPSGFSFPTNIPYEILDECYIPDNVATRAADIDWAAVERESFHLTGNDALYVAPTRAEAACPSGRITIVDEMADGEEVPVIGVKVAVNSFVKISTCFTDENGEYSLSRAYTSKVRYRLVFKNKRGFGIGLNLILVPGSVSTLGTSGPDGLSVKLDSSSDRKLFTRCIVNNAASDYFAWCDEEDTGVTPPASNLRIWLLDAMDGGAAPMLQQGALLSMDLISSYLGEFSSLVKMFLPDLVIGTKDLDTYASVYALVWHEMAHASHYEKVGNAYWNKYIEFILTSFVSSGGITYGTGNEENAGVCAVGEMWAYFLQTWIVNRRYSLASYTAGTGNWFHPQIYLYMNERGLEPGQIFKAMESSVTDRDAMRTRLLELYPEYKTVIRQAFERYEDQ